MKFNLIVLLFIIGNISLFSQKPAEELGFCGTQADLQSEKWLDDFLSGKIITFTPDEIIWVPMTTHIVNPSNGKASYSEYNVLNAMCKLNENFSEVGIQFYHSSFEYIFEDKYYDHDYNDGQKMMKANNINGTINTYFVNDPAGNCGYFSPSGAAVAVAFGCAGKGDDTWAHEIGHYLSLPHTFRGWEGEDYKQGTVAPNYVNNRKVELAENDPDCDNSGDKFCDTPADYLSFRWSCNDNMESPILQMDPDSTTFRSDGTYFMSYADSDCMDRFSPLQIDAMVANLQNQKPNQIDQSFSPSFVNTEDTTPLFPTDNDVVSTSNVTLEWNEIGNAIYYYLEVSTFEGFHFYKVREFVLGTSFEIEGLVNNKTYYWRLTPYGKSDFCNERTPTFSFQTSLAPTNTKDFQENMFEVYPNPSSGNFKIKINGQNEGSIQIMDTYGRTIRSFNTNNNTGSIDEILPSGIYFVKFETSSSKQIKKLIIQ